MTQFQDSYPYVIVGAGVAAASAAAGIREAGGTGAVAVLGAEPDLPVYRPDLSKTLWLDADASLEDSALDVTGEGVELHTSSTVVAIDPAEHRVDLADGTRIGFEHLLIATGASPRTGPIAPGPRVLHYRTSADYRALRAVATPGAHVAVVGGGYIGGEIASALLQNDVEVTLVLPHGTVQPGMFPPDLSDRVTRKLAAKGARIVTGRLAGGSEAEDSVALTLEDGTGITADAAVIGIGVTPNTALAQEAGIEVDDGSVRGVLLWNTWDSVDAARELIAETRGHPVAGPEDLRSRITPGG